MYIFCSVLLLLDRSRLFVPYTLALVGRLEGISLRRFLRGDDFLFWACFPFGREELRVIGHGHAGSHSHQPPLYPCLPVGVNNALLPWHPCKGHTSRQNVEKCRLFGNERIVHVPPCFVGRRELFVSRLLPSFPVIPQL
jgi:hypothetical protein